MKFNADVQIVLQHIVLLKNDNSRKWSVKVLQSKNFDRKNNKVAYCQLRKLKKKTFLYNTTERLWLTTTV